MLKIVLISGFPKEQERLKNWWVALSTFQLKTETLSGIQAVHGKYIGGAWNWAQMGVTELKDFLFLNWENLSKLILSQEKHVNHNNVGT